MDKQKEVIERSLKHLGFSALNEMQLEVLQKYNDNPNLLMLSKTGSGKTVAFLLPLLLNLKDSPFIQALILVPTRELAIQIEGVFKALKSNYKVTTCYGGHSMRVEENSLKETPAIVIGTPGRICDHITRENILLHKVEVLIVDEYDKCLEFGFEEQMGFIHEHLRNLKKSMLVSATELKAFPSYLNFAPYTNVNYLKNSEDPKIQFLKVNTSSNVKFETLYDVLCSFKGELTIVFCNYREATQSIVDYLETRDYKALVYHGGLEQEDRERALMKFRNGSCHTLICTDLGSRGLDIPEIQHVVHFQYPQTEEAFIHRNGRTARMKADGTAYLMINQDEQTPEYIDFVKNEYQFDRKNLFPTKSPWVTVYFSGGKKDKINKVDIVGFLTQKGGLKKEEIGLITSMDFATFVAVPREISRSLVNEIRTLKVKGKKLKIEISK